MNEEMTKIIEWLRTNRLSLNIEKTYFMMFRKRKQKITFNNELLIDDKKVEQVEKAEFLGVYVDSSLTWQDHIQYIEGKLARALGVICKTRKSFYTATLKTLYYSFLYPYLNYCIEVWVIHSLRILHHWIDCKIEQSGSFWDVTREHIYNLYIRV